MNPRVPGHVERVQANLLQVGVVAETDYPKARARVTIGGLKSAWLPWLALRAGANRTWDAIEVGEQVLVACPDGDPAHGVIIGAIYQTQYAAPADSADLTRTVYQDGAIIEYDRQQHALKATLPAGGTAEITARGGLKIIGPTEIEGTLTVTQGINANGGLAAIGPAGAAAMQLVGDMAVQGSASVTGTLEAGSNITAGGSVTSSGDQVAGSISQVNHVHTGVQTGVGESEKPKP